MITLEAAGRLLNFGARIGQDHRVQEQLEGAVAIHNILAKHRVAYLADEVGMGKTYVALGALALFRHFDPNFKLLVIAPRENIQRKWMKEAANFAAHNVRFADFRVSTIDGSPGRPQIACENLLELIHESIVDPHRDFFARLTSFSLPLGHDKEALRIAREKLLRQLPWLDKALFDLRGEENRELFKQNYARAICCALPVFDLVIIDEAHNLKHGLAPHTSARNHVLALALGHASGKSDPPLPGYGPRARRVLLLSATPLEDSYGQVWNQLNVCGTGHGFEKLNSNKLNDDDKKRVAAEFLVRRVTSIRTTDGELTKNQYRREWRAGGVEQHDDPIRIKDNRQRLVVALVQKKVSELLGTAKFNSSFQVGMLASFESFLETTKVKVAEKEATTFDDQDQTQDPDEREGIDVHDINKLARQYREKFGQEMPHPKMDTVVNSLSRSWITGAKTLLFVRRVASVTELKRRLDDRYDAWLIKLLRKELPASVTAKFDSVVARYEAEKGKLIPTSQPDTEERSDEEAAEDTYENRGGSDTFFAWYFRGDGPRGIVSGAAIQKRFITKSAAYATFFEENYAAWLLGVEPAQCLEALAAALKLSVADTRDQLRKRAAKYLKQRKKQVSGHRMEAAQGAALELLKDLPGALGARARNVLHERFDVLPKPHAREAPDIADWLCQPTFFTELRRPERAELRARLWPIPARGDDRDQFRESEIRRQILASVARLGHAFIDLYILTIRRIDSLDQRARSVEGSEVADQDRAGISDFLDMLETQRVTPDRRWAAYDELHEVSQHFELVLDSNAPEARKKSLSDTARYFGTILGEQQPIGGMSGTVSKRVVQQFRMPGYPFVLVTTDLLQEGEDLHTFCSSVQHYGISWTPSSMEQRVGRVDRIRSQTDRRLGVLRKDPVGHHLLQVYYPHLEDTVELLQVQRVLERMNTFLRLMHEGLSPPQTELRKIDVGKELAAGRRRVEAIRDTLKSAFPIPDWATKGTVRKLAVLESLGEQVRKRFLALRGRPLKTLQVDWEPRNSSGILMGTVKLDSGRVQPFALRLGSDGERIIIRCVSPVGRVNPADAMHEIAGNVSVHPARLGAILTTDERSYDLTVEEDVMLAEPAHDLARLELLLERVTRRADQLEQVRLPGQDQLLKAFRDDLLKEMGSGK